MSFISHYPLLANFQFCQSKKINEKIKKETLERSLLKIATENSFTNSKNKKKTKKKKWKNELEFFKENS